MKIFKKWWFWLIVVIVVIAFASSGGKDNGTTASSNTGVTPTTNKSGVAPTAKPEKYEVLEHKMVEENTLKYVVGKIKNNSGKEAKYVQIEINLYDKDGAQLGSALANINNLEIGATWQFKAIVLTESSKVASYKIKEITGF